jgi:tetratricopeptide (TPR) repeat protein
MAPEQASGKKDAVTTATDVYGLGALLYTLLAGRPPFRGDSALETIELVRLREPDPPTSIRGALDRDLQTICMTCLRKEPGRRYGSAAALADDLDRWALGEPIAARPLKHAERVWLWARREPLSAGLAAALVVLSFAAIVGLVASNVMISHERDLARAQRKIAEEESRHAQAERQLATERSQQARQAVDEMYTEVAEKWLYEQPKLSKVQRDFLEKALAFYEQFSREEGDDPAIQLERSKALSRLGWLQLRLGRPQEAAASLYKPVNILKSLVARYPDRPAYLEELGHVQATLASRFSEQKRWKEANQARESALTVYETLTRKFPAEPRYRIALATGEGQLGLQYQFTGRPLEAQKLAAASMSSLESLQRDFPGRSDPHDLSTRMRILEDVGCVLIENRRFAEAERALREAIAIADNLPVDTISHQDLLHRKAHTYLYLGYLLGRVGRAHEAEAIYLRAQAILEQLAADFPDLPLYQVDVVDARLGLVDVDRELGRRSAAEQRARSQVTESERLATAHPELVNCRRTLLAAWTRQGALLAAAGPPRELEAAYRRTVEVAEGLVAIEPPGAYPRHRLGNSLIALGNYLAASGREKEAAALLERARETLETLCNDCPAVPEFLQSLGEALSALGELKLAAGGRAECEHAYERALTLFRQVAPEAEHDPGLADRCVRGLTLCPLPRFRDPARAIELAGRAAVNFPNNPMLASTLGLARYRVSDWKGAIAALTASKKERDPGDVADWLILAMAHHRAGDKAQAKIWFERATSTAGDDVPRGRAWLSLREEAKAIMGIP